MLLQYHCNPVAGGVAVSLNLDVWPVAVSLQPGGRRRCSTTHPDGWPVAVPLQPGRRTRCSTTASRWLAALQCYCNPRAEPGAVSLHESAAAPVVLGLAGHAAGRVRLGLQTSLGHRPAAVGTHSVRALIDPAEGHHHLGPLTAR